MSALHADVAGIGLWLPGFPNAGAWAERVPLPADEEHKPTGRAYDRINRRRASQMGRALGDAVADAMEHAGVDARTTPVIVGSSIGEASAMIGLLDQMWRDEEPMSPAVFTVSVHNAASGLLSISAKNTGFTTSIAADYDTPAATLLEGLGLLATGHDAVCCVCADEASPKALLEHLAPEEQRHWDLLTAAIVLRRSAPTPLAQLRLVGATAPEAGDARIVSPELPEGFANNPQAGMLDLVSAIQTGTTGALRLDRGRGRGYVALISEAVAR